MYLELRSLKGFFLEVTGGTDDHQLTLRSLKGFFLEVTGSRLLSWASVVGLRSLKGFFLEVTNAQTGQEGGDVLSHFEPHKDPSYTEGLNPSQISVYFG